MPRPKRRLSYFVQTPDGACSITVRDDGNGAGRWTNHVWCRTFVHAQRWARRLGPGAVVIRNYLTGKHKGRCREFVYTPASARRSGG